MSSAGRFWCVVLGATLLQAIGPAAAQDIITGEELVYSEVGSRACPKPRARQDLTARACVPPTPAGLGDAVGMQRLLVCEGTRGGKAQGGNAGDRLCLPSPVGKLASLRVRVAVRLVVESAVRQESICHRERLQPRREMGSGRGQLFGTSRPKR